MSALTMNVLAGAMDALCAGLDRQGDTEIERVVNKPVLPPEDCCPECGSTRVEFHNKIRASIYEPASESGKSCYDCGHWFEPEDEATRLGI